MIFTTQLDPQDHLTEKAAIRHIANHIRRMQEELEYRLSVLDSSNISSIDATQTTILTEEGNLLSVLKDDSRYSQLEQTIDGLRSTVTQYGETVSGYENKMSVFQQTVDGFRADISRYAETTEGYAEEYARLAASVDGFHAQVENYTASVDSYTQQVSSFSQTANSLEATVSSIVSKTEDENKGKITSASLIMAINGNESSTKISADKVDITGITTFYSDNSSTGSSDINAIRIKDGQVQFLEEYGKAAITAAFIDYTSNYFGESSLRVNTPDSDISVTAGTGVNLTATTGDVKIKSPEGLILLQNAGCEVQLNSWTYDDGTSSGSLLIETQEYHRMRLKSADKLTLKSTGKMEIITFDQLQIDGGASVTVEAGIGLQIIVGNHTWAFTQDGRLLLDDEEY